MQRVHWNDGGEIKGESSSFGNELGNKCNLYSSHSSNLAPIISIEFAVQWFGEEFELEN